MKTIVELKPGSRERRAAIISESTAHGTLITDGVSLLGSVPITRHRPK
jgi:hypothetical protein